MGYKQGDRKFHFRHVVKFTKNNLNSLNNFDKQKYNILEWRWIWITCERLFSQKINFTLTLTFQLHF